MNLLPEIFGDYARYTRRSNHHCQFSDDYGFPRLVENCCQVSHFDQKSWTFGWMQVIYKLLKLVLEMFDTL